MNVRPIVRAMCRPMVRGVVPSAFSPLSIFANGEEGAWLSQEDTDTLFQDTSGLTPVAADGQSEGLILDKSGNANNATQPTTLAKPTYNTDGTYHWASFDTADDAIIFDVPAGGWNGTYVQGTMAGVIVGEISVPAGTYQIPTNPVYANDGTLTELVIRNDSGVIDPAELEQLIGYVVRRSDFNTSSMRGWFARRTDLTKLDTSNLQTNVKDCAFLCDKCTSLVEYLCAGLVGPATTDLRGHLRDATSLMSLDISSWVTSGLVGAGFFADGASALTTVVVYGGTGSPFSDSPCVDYENAFQNTNLSQQSIDDILTAIESAGTSNGTFDQSGGSAPSATGEAAIDALRARGWTVTVTGGY